MKTTKNKLVYEKDINDLSGKALAIVFPDSIQEIKNLIKISKTDIVLRGAGTNFSSSTAPKDSTIIDLSKMNKILEINPLKKIAIIEPGVILSELNEALADYSLEFPIIPLFPQVETMGGLIAKNSSGAREIKYGRMINWVDSLEIINGKGEQARISKSDLSDFVGMEGITGIIIQATLRLTNRKERSLTILKSDNLDFILSSNKKLRLDLDISSIDILDRHISLLLGFEKKYHLFVEYESAKGLFKGADYFKFIKMKNKAYNKIAAEGFHKMESIKIFADSLQDFIIHLEEKKIPFFGHLASGVIYPCFRKEEIVKQEDLLNFSRKLKAQISYNFGFGLKNKDYVPLLEKDLIRRVKIRHDPDWKLNRNKVLDYKLKDKEESKKEKKAEIEEIKKEEHQPQKEVSNLVQSELLTLKKPEQEISPEEKDKIKKLAFGFFGSKPSENKESKEEQS